MERALVIGYGQLGRALEGELMGRRISCLVVERSALELAEPERIPERLAGLVGPGTVVFLTAAFTNVDRAEGEQRLAVRVNGVAPGVVAQAVAQAGGRLVFFSTDYVFGHGHREPIPPEVDPSPLSVYGLSKLIGELAAKAADPGCLIIRLSGLFGAGKNFVRTVWERLRAGEVVRIVDDQTTRLTSARVAAWASVELAWRGRRGVWQVGLRGERSWFGYGRLIAGLSGADPELVVPITSRELNRPAERPNYSVLDISRTEVELGPFPRVEDEVGAYLRELESGATG